MAYMERFEYTTPGTYTWTAPAGITYVNIIAVGAGGSGGYQWSSGGGGGGGLGWKNNIPVTPGQSYTVVVGDKGGIVPNAYNNGGQGGSSYFINTNTVCGFGAGQGGTGSSGTGHGAFGGGYTGDGGGAGGNGAISGSWTHGGGGAGGYSGNGASRYNNTVATGGGGGAGQYYSSTYGTGAGGGVGLFGEGPSGETYANGTGYGGRGGSGGGDGMAGETANSSSNNIWERSAQFTTTSNYQIIGGLYGGGGGGSGTSRGGGYGGTGALVVTYPATGLAVSSNTVLNGDLFTASLTVLGAADNTEVPYTITGVSSSDINGFPLTGTLTLINQEATISFNVTPLTDVTFTLSTYGFSKSVTVIENVYGLSFLSQGQSLTYSSSSSPILVDLTNVNTMLELQLVTINGNNYNLNASSSVLLASRQILTIDFASRTSFNSSQTLNFDPPQYWIGA